METESTHFRGLTVPIWVRYGFRMATKATDTKELGQRVDRLRSDVGMTVVELANVTGIPLTTLQRRLAGDGRLTVAELRDISRALNVTPASWFGAAA